MIKRALLLGAVLSTLAGAAAAQIADPGLLRPAPTNIYDRGRNIGVLDRERPDYQALGIRSGGFTLYPRLETGIGYLDNVFAADTGSVSDGYVAIDPTLRAQSNWSRHSLTLSGGASLREFFTQGSQNENGWFVDALGRLDVGSASSASADVFARHIYEERTSGGFPGEANAPVPLTQTGLTLTGVTERSRLRLTGALAYDHADYDDVAAVGGGVLDQDFRDRSALRATIRADIARTPSTAFFAELGFRKELYDNPLPGGAANRDSDEFRGLVGATFDLTALMRGQVGVGYVNRSFDSGYRTLQGLSASATLEYFPTELTTVTLSASRQVEDSGDVISAGYFANVLEARVDHELLRNLILSADYRFEYDTFNGPLPDAQINQFGAEARYLLSRTVGVAATFRQTSRAGANALGGFSYDSSSFLLSVVLQR